MPPTSLFLELPNEILFAVSAQLDDVKDVLALTKLTCRSLAIRLEPAFCYRARSHVCTLEGPVLQENVLEGYTVEGSVLEWAASQGDISLARKLLKDCRAISSHKDRALCRISGCHANDSASENQNLEFAKLLLENGASATNGRDCSGFTALHHAAGNFESIVRLLLDHGADVNDQINSDGRTPLDCAIQNTKCIIQFEPIARLLFANGADPNAKTKYDLTPLLDTVRLRGPEYTEVLLANGASVHFCRREDGLMPLHISFESCDTMRLLLKYGADINATADNGYTTLHFAIAEFQEDAVRLLLEKGADVNARTDTGYTPLHIAVYGSTFHGLKPMRLLLERGANVKLQDEEALTPLDWAVKHEREEALELLLKAGADTEAINSPLQLAAKYDEPEAA
ncbi:hypothetical protein N7495_008355 [Penicillium taxi]|uniref:uncharacterized protein n=1 Tax=Penicillium taxi TaxID=168475 RepID=UPI002545090D|nr:uncharacterized protein N7495_008355 [Penicillium taxi]KAJ5888314.1 hypothetical protein N7495_008355 [Penicillium taxi]